MYYVMKMVFGLSVPIYRLHVRTAFSHTVWLWCSVAFVDSIDRMRPRSFLADRVQQTPGRTFRWHGLPVEYIVVGVNHMTRSHVAREKNKE